MSKFFRILDANINRISEGFRVLEDIARFYHDDINLSESIKKLRHTTRKICARHNLEFVAQRNSENDIGFDISRRLDIDSKSNLMDLVTANFKRTQEGIRSIEEIFKVLGDGSLSRQFEKMRYQSYCIEKEFAQSIIITKKMKNLVTDLYCITCQEHSAGRSNIEVARQMISAGIKIIQYRDKDKSVLDKYRECIKIREMTAEKGVTFLVNDHIDIAISVGADGVHLGQDDLPLCKARQLVGDMIIGISTHSPLQAKEAIAGGADYIGVGPIFKTHTKKDVCDPVGLEYLEYAVSNVKIPFVAIGGIKLHNVEDVKRKGAKCIAMVTEITSAPDIEEMILSIRNLVKNTKI
jgi:thiamine-phosphate pyrophosphorylase